MMRFHVLKMLRKYNIHYEVKRVKVPNYLGNMQTVNRGMVKKEMILELIEKMSENGFIDGRGHSFERVALASIKKLRKFMETL